MTFHTKAISNTSSKLINFQEAPLIIAEHLPELYNDEFVRGFVKLLEISDKPTEEHTQRVTVGSVKLARSMGLSNSEIRYIQRGALLHDIGKIFVPNNILYKTGDLTLKEWVILKRHPSNAYILLRPFRNLRPALDIPLCHHEKWDGTGYPRGLKGQQIPLSVRIFSVIDVWDALCSDRPYRAAWSQSDAMAYICAQSGKHFDPDITRVFLQVLNLSRIYK